MVLPLSVIVRLPAVALLSETVPVAVYSFVTELQTGVSTATTKTGGATVQLAGAEYVAVAVPQPVKLTVTVWLAASEVKPVSEYATEVAPAGTVINLVVVPILTEAVPPNRLLVNSISPETVYWLVAELQTVGVAVAVREQIAEASVRPISKV